MGEAGPKDKQTTTWHWSLLLPLGLLVAMPLPWPAPAALEGVHNRKRRNVFKPRGECLGETSAGWVWCSFVL